MNAQDGALFLQILLQDQSCPMDSDDLEEAIRLAGEYSPSAVFHRAAQYFASKHGETRSHLGFAKGTRWLAMIRRDEGREAFCRKADELRRLAP